MSSSPHSSSKRFWIIAATAVLLAAGELVAFGVLGRQYVVAQAQSLALLSQERQLSPEIGFQAALLLDDDNATAHQGLALFYIDRWQPDRAIQSLSEAPDTPELQLTRAKALMELGQAQGAPESLFTTAEERKRFEGGGVGETELLIAKGLPQSALRALQQDQTESARKYLLEASIWMNKPGTSKEEQEKAIAALTTGLQRHPINLALHRQLHATYVALGDEAQAQQQQVVIQKLEAGSF